MSRDITQLYPFTVRLENGMVYSRLRRLLDWIEQ